MTVDYEAQRQQQIEKNRQRLKELGLLQAVNDINQTIAQAKSQTRQQRAAKQAVSGVRPPQRVPSRRSERVQGKEPTNYNEQALAKSGLEEEEGGRRPRLLRENTQEEVYTLEQVKLLGSAGQPWELFVDGYDAKGERIYDKVNGQTCHQCRQKTLGKRTACACCKSLRGVFCGDCLYMRYGENVEEVNANPEWVCPVCRDLCNCSFHRIKKGWAPTGTLYRSAMREGFKSVAHYLVLTNLRPEDRPHVAGMMPEGWEWEQAEADSHAEPAGAQPAADTGAAAEAASEEDEDEEEEREGPSGSEEVAVAEQLLNLPEAEGQEAPAPAAAPRRSQRAQRGGSGSSSGSEASPVAQTQAAAAGDKRSKAAAGEQAQQAAADGKRSKGAAAEQAAAAAAAPQGVRRSGRTATAGGSGRQATIVEVSRKRKAVGAVEGSTPIAAKKPAAAAAAGKGAPASQPRGLISQLA